MNSLFVPNKSRLPSLPDVPTLSELGVRAEPGVYAVVATSRIIVAPAGVDKAIQGILVNAIKKATSDPEFVKQMKKAEFDLATAKPDEVKVRMKAAVDEFTAVKDMVKSYAK
jgi:tripartite-type tricarboxylate transporter receptor subunit TctC